MWVQCHVAGRVGRCQQKHSHAASLQDVVARPDCPLTKNSLKEVERWLIDLSTMSNSCTALTEQAGKERESDLPGESGSSSPVVEVFDPLQPIGPRVGKQSCNGWILALLQRSDCEVTHAFATAHQQPLWIRQKAAEEEAKIQMVFKHRDVHNPVKAGIGGTIS
jgi:hypothetical protein